MSVDPNMGKEKSVIILETRSEISLVMYILQSQLAPSQELEVSVLLSHGITFTTSKYLRIRNSNLQEVKK